MKSKTDLLQKIESLEWFITTLQKTLGWQLTVEGRRLDEKEYHVELVIKLDFKGKAWPDILRRQAYRSVVLEMVRVRLERLWDEEIQKHPIPRALHIK